MTDIIGNAYKITFSLQLDQMQNIRHVAQDLNMKLLHSKSIIVLYETVSSALD